MPALASRFRSRRHVHSPGQIALAAAALFGVGSLTACGGGGTGGPAPSGPAPGSGAEQTLSLGALTTRVVSNSPLTPVTTSGSNAKVTGIAGGTFQSLVLRDTSPSLSETRIVFASNARGTSPAYYSMNTDGSAVIRLLPVSNFFFNVQIFAWSPDGSKICYFLFSTGNLYTMNADGTGQIAITSGGNTDYAPSWSPDGLKIAFVRNNHIWVTNADGSGNLTQLTSGTVTDGTPTWSPDGSRIAFQRAVSADFTHIYSMNPDGSNLSQLTSAGANDYDSAWSPDGERIAFDTDRDGAGTSHIYVMNARGGFPKQLTNTSAQDAYPKWSPDSSTIVFQRTSTGGHQTYTINAADGSFPTNLTNNTVQDDEYPTWQPFQKTRVLLGVGGFLGNSAAGFLFGRTGDVVNSVLAFNAVTPGSAVVNAQDGQQTSGASITFHITADSLTALNYYNGTDVSPTTVLAGATNPVTAGALVDINSSTGKVSDVLPFAATSRAKTPAITREGATRVYRGAFLGIWDSRGKNLAPNGATEARLDDSTGAVLSFR